jgi:hypothetical protein
MLRCRLNKWVAIIQFLAYNLAVFVIIAVASQYGARS